MASYSPKYVDPTSLPLGGPDDYGSDEKLRALQYAESRLEGDVNGGAEISSPTHRHEMAANALATHVLTLAAEEETDVRIGDLQGDNSAMISYATRWKELYNEMVHAIEEAEATGGSGEHVIVSTDDC